MYTVQHYSTDVMEFSTTLSCRKYLTVKKRFEIRIQLCTCLNTFMFITFTKTLIDYFVFWKRSFLNIRIRLIFLLCTTRSVFFFKIKFTFNNSNCNAYKYVIEYRKILELYVYFEYYVLLFFTWKIMW